MPATMQALLPLEYLEALARALGRRLEGLLAVLLHGAHARGEVVPGAPVELLLVLKQPVDEPARAAVVRELGRLRHRPAGWPLELGLIESYRLGWLRPSVLQQSLRAGARLLFGDATVLEVIPAWPPARLDRREALDELAAAEAALAGGWEQLARLHAAGGLLLARGGYQPAFAGRAAAVARQWPEAPLLASFDVLPAVEYVARSRALVEDWLFTWEGEGLPAAARERYVALWRAARASLRPPITRIILAAL
jgi:predicted nucleotidyltransferase